MPNGRIKSAMSATSLTRLCSFSSAVTNFTPPDYQKRNKPNSTALYDPAAFNTSRSGLVQVSYSNYAFPLGSWAQKAIAAVGVYPQPLGFDSGTLMGSAWTTSTVNPVDAKRSSSETAYLDGALQTTSLTVYHRTLALRIMFSNKNSANGVLVKSYGKQFMLSARKEVIVSAGAFQSPQLLIVSGIGPAETLRKHNITVKKDLPGVGQNLWDQPLFSVAYRVNVPTASMLLNDAVYAAQALEQYHQNASGPYSAPPSFLGI